MKKYILFIFTCIITNFTGLAFAINNCNDILQQLNHQNNPSFYLTTGTYMELPCKTSWYFYDSHYVFDCGTRLFTGTVVGSPTCNRESKIINLVIRDDDSSLKSSTPVTLHYTQKSGHDGALYFADHFDPFTYIWKNSPFYAHN